jgi:hypothetical protein
MTCFQHSLPVLNIKSQHQPGPISQSPLPRLCDRRPPEDILLQNIHIQILKAVLRMDARVITQIRGQFEQQWMQIVARTITPLHEWVLVMTADILLLRPQPQHHAVPTMNSSFPVLVLIGK